MRGPEGLPNDRHSGASEVWWIRNATAASAVWAYFKLGGTDSEIVVIGRKRSLDLLNNPCLFTWRKRIIVKLGRPNWFTNRHLAHWWFVKTGKGAGPLSENECSDKTSDKF